MSEADVVRHLAPTWTLKAWVWAIPGAMLALDCSCTSTALMMCCHIAREVRLLYWCRASTRRVPVLYEC